MPAPDLPEVPESLKAIKIYLKIANEHDSRDLVISYWCRLEALQKGLKLSSKSPQEMQFLMPLMDWLEATKKGNRENEAITNDIVAQAHIENWALKLFLYADKNDCAGNFNINVIQAFYTAAALYELLRTFGPLGEEAERNIKYAKWKATYIHNCLKKGETPVAGPVNKEDVEGLDDDDDLADNGDLESEENNELNFDEIEESGGAEEEKKADDEKNEETEENNESNVDEADQNEKSAEENAGEIEPEGNEADDEKNEETEENNESNVDEADQNEKSAEENAGEIEPEKNEEPNGNEVDKTEEADEEKAEEVEPDEKTADDENDEAGTSHPTSKIPDFPSVPTSNYNENKDGNSPVNQNPYNPAPTPTNSNSNMSFDKPDTKAKTAGGVELGAEQTMKAQKLIKWASSALNYDDVPTAVMNLQKALHLLQTGQEIP